MRKGPVGQYANYTDEGMERANDSQSVKCSYCLLAGADPLTLFSDPQGRGHFSGGGVRGHFHALASRGVAMVTALAGWMARSGVGEARGSPWSDTAADVTWLV